MVSQNGRRLEFLGVSEALGVKHSVAFWEKPASANEFHVSDSGLSKLAEKLR